MRRLGFYEYPELGIEAAIKVIEKIRHAPPSFESEEDQDDADEDEPSEDEYEGDIDPNKLAKLMRHSSASSGAFRDKIAALRKYGLVTEGGYSLTELAERILNPPTDDDYQLALVEVRDNIELFAKLVEARIDLSNDTEAEAVIKNVCDIPKKNNQKKIKKILSILQGFANIIGKKNWYGRFIDDGKLERNLKRLKDPRLAVPASAALWSQFNDKPTSALQILKVFNVLRKIENERISVNLLKAIRDGIRRLELQKNDMNRICDYFVEIILRNYDKDRRDRAVDAAEVAIQALYYLRTERHYDKLLACMFDYCKNNMVFSEGWEDETGESYGRPEELLLYLTHVNRDKCVEAIWSKMRKENDKYKRGQLERLLERIGEIKLVE